MKISAEHPRGSLPWDIYKLVSDSPHSLDIFFLCNLTQLLADIPDDTEHCTAYIHRLFLPDCLVDLLFGKDSSWLTGKVNKCLKFISLCKRKCAPLVRNLMLDRINTKSGIVNHLPSSLLQFVWHQILPEAVLLLFQMIP